MKQTMSRQFKSRVQEQENINKAMDSMKYEIADELGIFDSKIPNGAQTTSRHNGVLAGPVGGEMTKRMVQTSLERLEDEQKQ